LFVCALALSVLDRERAAPDPRDLALPQRMTLQEKSISSCCSARAR
jgi:hypothetical protein